MDGGAWWAAVRGVAGSRTRLSNFTVTFHFHALEKEMAPHSSVLAWRIPGTGEPGGPPSMGLHRVGHDWSDLAAAAAEKQNQYRLRRPTIYPMRRAEANGIVQGPESRRADCIDCRSEGLRSPTTKVRRHRCSRKIKTEFNLPLPLQFKPSVDCRKPSLSEKSHLPYSVHRFKC